MRKVSILQAVYRATQVPALRQPFIEVLEPRVLFSAITESGGLTPGSMPCAMATAPDGSVWFVEGGKESVGRVTMDGQITEFPLPLSQSYPSRIVTGPDGNMWCLAWSGGNGLPVTSYLDRITAYGDVESFVLPSPASTVAVSKDGKLVVADDNWICWINTDGVITKQTNISRPMLIDDLVVAPDNSIWFNNALRNELDRISPDGTISVLPVTSDGAQVAEERFTFGPDGNIWVASSDGRLFRVTPDGQSTPFSLPGAGIDGIIAGPDGNLWCSFNGGNGRGLARITTAGTITQFYTPTAESMPAGLTIGLDGNIWFSEAGVDQIGRLDLAEADRPIASLVVTPQGAAGDVGTALGGTIATFIPAQETDSPADYTAIIDWGDGQKSDGVVVAEGSTFAVMATHVYASAGLYGTTQYHANVQLQSHDAAGSARFDMSIPGQPPFAPPNVQSLSATDGEPYTGVVLTLTRNNSLVNPNNYYVFVTDGADGTVACDLTLGDDGGTVLVTPARPLVLHQGGSGILLLTLSGPDIAEQFIVVTVQVAPPLPSVAPDLDVAPDPEPTTKPDRPALVAQTNSPTAPAAMALVFHFDQPIAAAAGETDEVLMFTLLERTKRRAAARYAT